MTGAAALQQVLLLLTTVLPALRAGKLTGSKMVVPLLLTFGTRTFPDLTPIPLPIMAGMATFRLAIRQLSVFRAMATIPLQL